MNAKKNLALLLALLLTLMTGLSTTAALAEGTDAEEPTSFTSETAYVDEAISPYKEMLNRESDPTMQSLYTANDLATILEKHSSITVSMRTFQADGTVSFFEVTEVSKNADGSYDMTCMRTTSRGTAIGKGNSNDGYFVWTLADGTLRAMLSQPDEFLFIAQEEYLDSIFYADYYNVTSAEKDGQLYITADMSYAGEAVYYKEYFWADPVTEEITAMEERYEGPNGEMRSEYTVTYDEPYEKFWACDALEQAKNADDAADLTLVFVAPEFNYYSTVTYHMSASIAKYIDTDGYFKIYSSANFDPSSRMDTITMNGDTTLYVLLLSYENAVMDMENNADAASERDPVAASKVTPTAAPEATPAPVSGPELVITKSPTAETVNAGGQAIFVAYANNATAITWLFAGPDNTIVLAKDAPNYFGCSVNGLGTGVITVSNIPASMNGWSVQCRFDGNGGPKWTSAAPLTVRSNTPVPTPTPAPTPVPTSAPVPGPTPAPGTDSNLEEEAKALAWDNLYSIASRTQSYGWDMGTMQNFYYDPSVQTAQYDITASCNGMSITAACRSYPEQDSYQPSSVWVSLNGSEIFSDSFAGANESQAWAAFINDVSAIAGKNVPPPAPAPVVETSGEFVGYTGTILKLVVRWNAKGNGDGTVNLTLNAYVEHSTLHYAALYNSLCFQVNGDAYSTTSGSISNDEPTTMQTYVGSYSTVVSSGNVPVVVNWTFNGTYSEQSIGTIQASAVLPLG